MNRERFYVELVALTTRRWRDRPAARRMARTLKYALRACGLEAEHCGRLRQNDAPAPTDDSNPDQQRTALGDHRHR